MTFFFIQEEAFYLLQRSSFYGHDIRYFMGYLIVGPKLFHCWFLFVRMFVWWILRYLYITTTNKSLKFVIYISYNREDYSNSKYLIIKSKKSCKRSVLFQYDYILKIT